jgi:hypothetical protein
LVLVKKHLEEINRPTVGQMKSNRSDGRGGRLEDNNSVRSISKWLDNETVLL